MSGHIGFVEAVVIGAMQGFTELFPVSSLGHSVLVPAMIGGGWAADLNVSAPESPYLAVIVGLHVATALALIVYFWRDWIRILGGFASSVRYRRVSNPDERLAWMIILGTIPVGIAGLALEHTFRTVLGRPTPAAIFLMVNGAVLYAAERLRRRAEVAPRARNVGSDSRGTVFASRYARSGGGPSAAAVTLAEVDDESPEGRRVADLRLAEQGFGRAILIASAQILALLPGISRSGITMAAGLWRGLSHEDAARFSFLLATPVILAAGLLKLPDLAGPLGEGIRGQVLAGSVASAVAAYLSVRFLIRFFRTRTLTPFAVYCAAAGAISLAVLTLR